MLRTYRRAAGASTKVGSHDGFPAAIQAKPAGNSSEIRRSTTFLARHAYVMPHDDPRTTQRVQNRPSEAPKSTLGGSRIEPRSPRRGPGAAKSSPGVPQSVPRASQERLKSAPRAPKSVPRAPKSVPGGPQEGPKKARRGSQEQSKRKVEI